MNRVAVIGANGQVAAEVCLLLRNHPEIELVPICRNHTGSAFLRYLGIRCRHGLVADAREAPHLLGDCNVVLDFAIPLGQPREAMDTNRRLIENSALHSAPGAKIVYFSTLSVYRRFQPAGSPPWSTAYGTGKYQCERIVRHAAARHGKEAYILRLGHVCGELQNITSELRRIIDAGAVIVPQGGDLPSGTVYTVTIVDAVLRILGGFERPGAFDLLSAPPWSWRQVLEREARACGQTLTIDRPTDDSLARGSSGRARMLLTRPLTDLLRKMLSTPGARDIGMRLLYHLSADLNQRAQARHFRRRASAEISRLIRKEPSSTAFTFAPAGATFLSSLSRTEDLLEGDAARLPDWDPRKAFSPDLYLYESDGPSAADREPT